MLAGVLAVVALATLALYAGRSSLVELATAIDELVGSEAEIAADLEASAEGGRASVSAASPTASSGSGSGGSVSALAAGRVAPTELLTPIPVGPIEFERAIAHLAKTPSPGAGAPWEPARMIAWVEPPKDRAELVGPLRIEYSMDVDLTREVFRILRRGRVPRGHVIVLEPDTGRILAYASTDPGDFPPTEPYPAASLVKVVTAAAALDTAPDVARGVCRYRGSPYRLTPSRVYPPRRGREISLERSLATSNNQCFAQLAVNAVGGDALLAAIGRFGWLRPPAPGHGRGSATAGDDDYDLGRLGCGLAGCRITPLHAAQLADSLARGQLVEPYWVERIVDVRGRSIALPPRSAPRHIMTPEVADELRSMLVRTTTRGTARSAFRDRRGRPRLGDVRVAAKTGNLTGDEPYGRYEWFMGVAPAEAPTIAVAVLQLQADLWWVRSSEIGADVLSAIFCEQRDCRPELATRFTGTPAPVGAGVRVPAPDSLGRF